MGYDHRFAQIHKNLLKVSSLLRSGVIFTSLHVRAAPFVVDGVAGRRPLSRLAHDLFFLLLFLVLLLNTVS